MGRLRLNMRAGMSGCFWCGSTPNACSFASAGEAVDGALLVAGRAVVLLLGDSGEVGGVVFGGHGYGAEEETGEGGVLVQNFAALCVDVEEIEGWCWGAGFFCETGFDTAEEEFENR